METSGLLDEYHDRAYNIHSVIVSNRDNPEINMGVPSVRYWDELAQMLQQGFFRKPYFSSNKRFVRNTVLNDREAFAFLAFHIRLEFVVDGELRFWDGYGSEITRNPDSTTDFLLDKLGPYLLEFTFGNNISLFKGVLQNI